MHPWTENITSCVIAGRQHAIAAFLAYHLCYMIINNGAPLNVIARFLSLYSALAQASAGWCFVFLLRGLSPCCFKISDGTVFSPHNCPKPRLDVPDESHPPTANIFLYGLRLATWKRA